MVREALTSQRLGALEAREAAAWLIARRSEGLTSSEQQLLTHWLGEDEAHQRVFESADRAWQSFEGSPDDEILAAMRARALAPRPRTFAMWQSVAAAAAVLVLLAGAVLYLSPALNPWGTRSSEASLASNSPVRYVSRVGQVRDIALPDGSTMILDADSEVALRFDTAGRAVQLQKGRAFFTVMPDSARPFAVTVATRRVVAVGTRFDVDLVDNGLIVTLLDGHLKIVAEDSPAAPVMLEPGQQFSGRGGTWAIRTIGAATENEVSWRVGLIHFDDQRLSEAAAVMNRYSQEKIVISDPAVADMRVSGQFRAGDTQRFAATVADLRGLKFVSRGNQIELVPRR